MRPSRWINKGSLPVGCLVLVALTGSTGLRAQDEIAELTARGQELFFERERA